MLSCPNVITMKSKKLIYLPVIKKCDKNLIPKFQIKLNKEKINKTELFFRFDDSSQTSFLPVY